VPAFAEHEESLRAALVEVAQTGFFAFVADSDPGQFAELVRHPPVYDPEQLPRPVGWLVTTVGFRGALVGHLEITMPDTLAVQLLGAFLGLAAEDPVTDALVADSAGEFASQICGMWLTRACQQLGFDLQPPEVLRMPQSWFPLDVAPPGPDDGDVLVSLNDLPLRLRVRFQGEPA
jgi:chemotaxis protein CheY-P-specific phosphatase CheC